VKGLLVLFAALIVAPAASAQLAPAQPFGNTEARLIHYIAHDGVRRTAWLLLPIDLTRRPVPLVISPHGRGVGADENALLWGDLPGEGDFAVINPAGEGRRLHWFSWGAPGQISDLARMPQIAEANGVDVDRRRIYAFGGSMGGQETLLLAALHPRLLAGAAAFDPATDMRRRYYDFAALKGGATLQALAREELGGTPTQDPRAYADRSPDHYVRELAFSHVPLQIYWSTRDRVIADQYSEAGALCDEIKRINPYAPLWEFEGEWAHTAEMRSNRRLPRALARFHLLPWRDVPMLPETVRPARSQPV
jgi:pimeloyl-ACP methyl ester carboxylesterase